MKTAIEEQQKALEKALEKAAADYISAVFPGDLPECHHSDFLAVICPPPSRAIESVRWRRIMDGFAQVPATALKKKVTWSPIS